MLAMMQTGNLGLIATSYTRDCFEHLGFSGIKFCNADQTFDYNLIVLIVGVGYRQVNLLNLESAYADVDSVAYVTAIGVLLAWDLLFIGCTQIVWAGPTANQVTACANQCIAFDASTVVPSHCPVNDSDGDKGARRSYNCFYVSEQAEASILQGFVVG
ncbi:hypothetical protein [Mycobacterium lepromatosis]